jgi:hypothetical protein
MPYTNLDADLDEKETLDTLSDELISIGNESMPAAEFAQLETELAQRGVEAVLDRLAEQLRERKRYHELFEALKMRVRWRLGLPLLHVDAGDRLDESQRNKLEDGLIEACREVGMLLLREGNIREGWMYLRPVGDKEAVARELANVEPQEDKIDELVEVALHEGVDPKLGFKLLLQRYGTCNAITTFDSVMFRHSKAEQQAAAGLLVEHVHAELLSSVKADITRQEGVEPQPTTLGELVAERDWLFLDNSYHIDTTHLASTVRFARILQDPAQLRSALDLTRYGRRLGSQFQYQGDEPFADIYPSHALYLGALLGENVDDALEYFRAKAQSLDVAQHGMAAIEVYIDLLARLGRYQEAIQASTTIAPDSGPGLEYAPRLLELSLAAESYEALLRICRERDDLLGFATGLVHAQLADTHSNSTTP